MAERKDVPDELLRFNAFLAQEAEAKRQAKRARKAEADRERRVADAEAAKQRAAERIRVLNAGDRATREQKEQAEQVYRDALEAHRRAVAGEPEPELQAEAEPEAEAEVKPEVAGESDTSQDEPAAEPDVEPDTET
jgi:colicin import membrane protein